MNPRLSVYIPLNSRKWELPGFSNGRSRVILTQERRTAAVSHGGDSGPALWDIFLSIRAPQTQPLDN